MSPSSPSRSGSGPPPGTEFGNFRLVSLVGEGAMGQVFRAVNRQVARIERAVKVIKPQFSDDQEFRDRFLDEAALMGQLHHPNLLRVDDVGEAHGMLFLVTELLSGESVAQLLERSPLGLPLPLAVDVVSQALRGIDHAHAQGVLHRDIKPANLFRQPDGSVKVLDFGLARAMAARGHTQAGAMPPGTPTYYPPELLSGAKSTPQGDIYAAGITLFELVTGRPPFMPQQGDPNGPFGVLLMHRDQPLPDITRLRQDVPRALAQVVQKACAKQPADRFASAAAMVAALEAIGLGAGDEPMTLARPSLSEAQLAQARAAALAAEPSTHRRGIADDVEEGEATETVGASPLRGDRTVSAEAYDPDKDPVVQAQRKLIHSPTGRPSTRPNLAAVRPPSMGTPLVRPPSTGAPVGQRRTSTAVRPAVAPVSEQAAPTALFATFDASAPPPADPFAPLAPAQLPKAPPVVDGEEFGEPSDDAAGNATVLVRAAADDSDVRPRVAPTAKSVVPAAFRSTTGPLPVATAVKVAAAPAHSPAMDSQPELSASAFEVAEPTSSSTFRDAGSQLAFDDEPPENTVPGASSSVAKSSGVPVWAWAVGALVLVVLAALALR